MSTFGFTDSGQENFWVRRLHTMVMVGNAAALILLVNLIKDTEVPMRALQDNLLYLAPFGLGLLLAGSGALVAAHTTTPNLVLKELNFLLHDLNKSKHKIDMEKAINDEISKCKGALARNFAISLSGSVGSGFMFMVGLSNIAFIPV